MQISVKGGTNAGWRRVYAARGPWVCPSCGDELAGYWTKCPNCGGHREP